MKRIGLVGDGMGPVVIYRRCLKREIARRLGYSAVQNRVITDRRSAQLTSAIQARDWMTLAEQIRVAVERLASLGAKGIVLCSSMLHVGADQLDLKLPILHVADATLSEVCRAQKKIKYIGLLGTRCREEDLLWRAHFERAGGPDIFVPTEQDREKVTHIIVDELWRDIVNMSSAESLMRVIYSLRQAGARAVVLAVPELALPLSYYEEAILPIYNAEACQIAATAEWVCSIRKPRRLLWEAKRSPCWQPERR